MLPASRRPTLAGLARLARLVPLLAAAGAWAQAGDEAAWQALARPGALVLFRHAYAPGVGDPPGMRLGDCASQRNLDEQGRDEARRLGEQFRRRGLRVEAVLSSQWCRARETAQLAFAGQSAQGLRDEPAFNSWFGGQGDPQAQTAAAREILRRWRGSGVLVVVTHQVNVSGLTGVALAPAQGLVVRVPAGKGPLQVIGSVGP